MRAKKNRVKTVRPTDPYAERSKILRVGIVRPTDPYAERSENFEGREHPTDRPTPTTPSLLEVSRSRPTDRPTFELA